MLLGCLSCFQLILGTWKKVCSTIRFIREEKSSILLPVMSHSEIDLPLHFEILYLSISFNFSAILYSLLHLYDKSGCRFRLFTVHRLLFVTCKQSDNVVGHWVCKSQSNALLDQSLEIQTQRTLILISILNISPNNQSVTCRQSRALLG